MTSSNCYHMKYQNRFHSINTALLRSYIYRLILRSYQFRNMVSGQRGTKACIFTEQILSIEKETSEEDEVMLHCKLIFELDIYREHYLTQNTFTTTFSI